MSNRLHPAAFRPPALAAAGAGDEMPFAPDYGYELAPDPDAIPADSPPPPVGEPEPRRSVPLVGVTPWPGGVTGTGQTAIAAGATVLVGMTTPVQPQALALTISASGAGLEIVPAMGSTMPGYGVPSTNPGLTIANVSAVYVRNTTGGALTASWLVTGHAITAKG